MRSRRSRVRSTWAALAALYVLVCIYFVGLSQGWPFIPQIPFAKNDSADAVVGPIAGLFGTPLCALMLFALCLITLEWRRLSRNSSWSGLPMPLAIYYPTVTIIGKISRVIVLLAVFGFGMYAQVHLLKKFLDGNVYPANSQCTETRRLTVEAVSAGITALGPTVSASFRYVPEKHCPSPVISSPMEHFRYRFGSLVGQHYRFASSSGPTYFAGWTPWVYLTITTFVAITWLVVCWEWIVALVELFSCGASRLTYALLRPIQTSKMLLSPLNRDAGVLLFPLRSLLQAVIRGISKGRYR